MKLTEKEKKTEFNSFENRFFFFERSILEAEMNPTVIVTQTVVNIALQMKCFHRKTAIANHRLKVNKRPPFKGKHGTILALKKGNLTRLKISLKNGI